MRNHETRSRLNTREIIKDCIDPEAWTEKERIVQGLQAKLMANDLQNHVLLQSLGGGEIGLLIFRVISASVTRLRTDPVSGEASKVASSSGNRACDLVTRGYGHPMSFEGSLSSLVYETLKSADGRKSPCHSTAPDAASRRIFFGKTV